MAIDINLRINSRRTGIGDMLGSIRDTVVGAVCREIDDYSTDMPRYKPLRGGYDDRRDDRKYNRKR